MFEDATGKQVWQYLKTAIEEPLIDFINKYEKKRGPPNQRNVRVTIPVRIAKFLSTLADR